MRTAIALLVFAGIVLAMLAACRARDDTVADSAAGDNARGDESQSESAATTGDSGRAAPPTASTRPTRDSRVRAPAIQRVDDSVRDSTLPPQDSIRAMRPKVPQVTPEKRPREWRGFKLPEERPVRIPLEQALDTTMKGDSTKPPKPDR
jgi:hypothetical protein